jgi:hypothetical protein
MRGVLTRLLLVLDLGLAVVEEEELEPVFIIVVSLVRHVASVLLVVAESAVGVLRNDLADRGAPARRWSAVVVAHLGSELNGTRSSASCMRSTCRGGGVYICGGAFCIVACAEVA